MNAIIESLNVWGARFAGFALPMLAQSAVLIALLFALDLVLRKRARATMRYTFWMLALVKLALPPTLASPTSAAYWLAAEAAASDSARGIAPVARFGRPDGKSPSNADGAVHATAVTVTGLRALTPRAVLFLIWLTMASGAGIWVLWRLRVVIGVVQNSVEAPESVRALLASCRQQLGINQRIPVRSAAIGSPAICGLLRPVILLPPTLSENLDASEMRSVLLHELAHFKRGDLWVNHAQIFLQVVYWYNPLLWLANAAIRQAREQAVDEMVLVEMGVDAQAYPATLLHVAKLGLGQRMAAMGFLGILEPGRGLTRRILHIMNRPLPRTARIGAGGLALALLLAVVALPMAGRNKTEPAVALNSQAPRSPLAAEPTSTPVGAEENTTADGSPSTSEIFKRAREKYASLTNYSDEGKTVATLNGMTLTTTFNIRLARPDLYRIEWEQNSDSGFSFTATKSLQAVWSEGNGDFLEFAGRGAQKEKNQEVALSSATGISGGAASTIPGTFFKMHWGNQLGGPVAAEKRKDDEKVGDTDCYVFTNDTKGGSRTLWIGKQDFLIHQVRNVTSADGLKAAMDEAAKHNPGVVRRPQILGGVVSTETHTKIVLNQNLSPAAFAR